MSVPNMKPVFSNMVTGIGHDAATNELFVQWPNGKISVYANVPAELADQAGKATSVGKFLHEQVKTKFEHRYLGGDK